MDIPKENQEELQKEHSVKASLTTSKPVLKKLVIPAGLILVSLLLIVFIQGPQIFIQRAATTVPPTNSSCSAVPFYCMILGGAKTCTRPKVCPTPPPPQGFVPQAGAPKIATGSATPASGSATPASSSATCATPSAILTSKTIIHFDTDSGNINGYTIRAVDMSTLDKFAAALKKYPSATVTINGYTDSVPFAAGTAGPINNNQALSLARANAAKTYLQNKGATENIYVVKGNGATNFVAPNNPKTGNILNRRDEITTDLGAKSCTPIASSSAQPVCSAGVNWSGYIHKIPAKTTKSSLATSWTMSTVTCSGKLIGISQWPGIMAGNKDIAQLGTISGCTAGKADNRAWVVHPPSLVAVTLPTTKYPAKPGDTLTASITMTSLGKFTTTISNTTRKWSYSSPMTFTAADNKLLFEDGIILENEGYGVSPNVPGLTKFTQSPFNNNTFSENNGASESFDKATGLSCLDLNATGKVKEDTTSPMNSANFNIKWLHQ